MHQARSDLNVDSTATRSNRRPAFTVAAGLVALAIGAFVLVAERGGAGSNESASVVPLAAIPAEGTAASTNPTSATDPAKPKFERSDEPAYEDSEKPHGG